jgi:DNA-binding NtrC family response regulator
VTPPAILLRLNRRTLVNVLILGGSAEARRAMAHAFHRASPLRGGPFVAVDAARDHRCLSASLEAYLSATAPTPCGDPLRAAEGGTLFVDSVNLLSRATQGLLLEFTRRLGSLGELDETWAGRLVVGSQESLAIAVAEGCFGARLYDALDKLRIELDRAVRGVA